MNTSGRSYITQVHIHSIHLPTSKALPILHYVYLDLFRLNNIIATYLFHSVAGDYTLK